MPPASKKNCGLILFDVGSSNKDELFNGLIKFSIFKWFMNSKSIYRLILVNSATTKNDKDYSGIYTTDLNDGFDPQQVTDLIKTAEKGKANWLDALLLGIHHLKEAASMPGLVTLQLIFFTSFDLVNAPKIDKDKIKRIINELNQHKIFLYIIGPNVQLPFIIKSYNCVEKCMKELQVDENNPNLTVTKEIVESVKNSIICNTKIGVNLLITFRFSEGTQPWTVPLSFGNNLAIPVSTCKIYRKDISLKLHTPVIRSTQKTVASEPQVTLDDSNIIKGIIRHGKLLQMEDEMFRCETERCFDIIGFTDIKFIPETYLQGEDTYYVLPKVVTDDCFHLFTYLVNILAETKKYAIVKRVYARNNRARYYALIPNLKNTPKCLTMCGLPYSGGLVPHKCKTAKEPTEPIEEDDFFRYFNSLMIDRNETKEEITLGPTMMMDFYQHKIINSLAKKYLQTEDLTIDNLDINDLESPSNNKFLESFKQSWPTRNPDSLSKDDMLD